MLAWPCPSNMSVSILPAGQWPSLATPLPLAKLVDALESIGLGVSVAYPGPFVANIYTWSRKSLSSVAPSIRRAVICHKPPFTTITVYYVIGENIMVWDRSRWDRSFWSNDPVMVYP